jgi:hypothetical protein
MKPLLQADADLNENIVTGVIRREPQIDFQTATQARLFGLPDPSVLSIAARQNRILVTHDRRTMPTHFANFILQQNSPGVFIIRKQLGIRAAIEELILIWAASDHSEWANRIVKLPL